MNATFDPIAARRRLVHLVRERAFKDGLDVVLASGKRSTFYVHGKKVTLHPEGLHLISRLMLDILAEHPEITAIGGLAIGADPISAGVAALSHTTGQNISAFMVRKEAKGHGIADQVEGDLQPGQKVCVVEDTVTTGGSARKAIEAVRAVGAEVALVLAVVDRQDEDADAFRKEFNVRSLVTLEELRADA